jgi:hypothetical protein
MQFWFPTSHQCTIIFTNMPTKPADSSAHDGTSQCLHSKDIDGDHRSEEMIKTFPTMLNLISGTLVGGVNYSDLYIDSDEDEDTSLTISFVNENDKEHGRKKTNVKY